MQENLKQILSNLNLENFIPYIENTTYLVLFFIFLTIILFYLISFSKTFHENKEKSIERKKPSLNEIIDKDEVKISDDNDFVDVLVAIEEKWLS